MPRKKRMLDAADEQPDAPKKRKLAFEKKEKAVARKKRTEITTEPSPPTTNDIFTELAETPRPSSSHLVVEAYAGTGKTFTQIVGVCWAFGQARWEEIQRGVAVRINQRAGRQKVDPDTFEITPSQEQLSVWQAMALRQPASVTYCAFNKSIVKEFQSEWGWVVPVLKEIGVDLRFATINGLGHSVCMRHFGQLEVQKNRTWEMSIGDLDPREVRGTPKLSAYHSAISELARLCKLNLTGWASDTGFLPESITSEDLWHLSAQYDVDLDMDSKDIARAFEEVPKILSRCLNLKNRVIDYDDQNWIPVVLGLKPRNQVDTLLVDEGQDLPRTKQEFSLTYGKRIILVGDRNQAIYAFAGADSESIPRMKKLLGVEHSLKLSETRRCSQAIVREAQRIVPDFKAHKDNPEGSVNETRLDLYHEFVTDGSMILCRVNAPLVGQALRFIKDGRKAMIRGREFGKTLIKHIEKFRAENVPDLIKKSEEWTKAEIDSENATRAPNDTKIIALNDKHACVRAFSEGTINVSDVIRRIELLFVGKECPKCKSRYDEETAECYHCKVGVVTPKGILLSSIHKAKGLEADRVFVFKIKGGALPHPMARTPADKEGEKNLEYVAITRGITDLYWVYDPPKKDV